MGFEVVLFDYGGTLDGPGDPWLRRFDRCYRECGIDVSPADLDSAFGHATRRSYADPGMRRRRLRETIACHVAWQAESLGLRDEARLAAVVDAFVRQTRVNLTATARLLERLAGRTRLGVISNFYGNVELLLDEAGIARCFEVILDSTVVGVAKPDPAIFRLAIERLGADPDRALHVGDSVAKDVAGARAAGLRAAWLPGAATHDPDVGAADFVLRQLGDVEDLVG